MTELLALVPARAGSSSLPRKNMRTLDGRPLVAHAVDAIRAAAVAPRIVVSTDDATIRVWALMHGCEVHERRPELAGDEVDLGELAAAIADDLDAQGLIGVFPPTSPFRSPRDISEAAGRLRRTGARSLSSCVALGGVHWHAPTGEVTSARELAGPRRGELGPTGGLFADNGAIYLVRASDLRATRRLITADHVLYEMGPGDSLRVQEPTDLLEARRRLERGAVVFRVRANRQVGSGHAFHCLQLADELADQEVSFLLKDCERWVGEMIRGSNYLAVEEHDLARDLERLGARSPRLVVNDVLDTPEEDVLTERRLGYRVVSVEDLGPGARFADWVVNALYRSDRPHANTVWGPRYATLRDEFHDLPGKVVRDVGAEVLIAFGGTDPAGLAPRCARLLSDLGSGLHVVVGPGAPAQDFPEGVRVSRSVPSMAQAMLAADLVLTSAGRTVYEAARTGTPMVVLAQNAREATHAHLGYDTGVVFLGIGALVGDDQIAGVVRRLLGDGELRRELSRRLRASIDDHGTRRIGTRIRELLYDAR